MDKRFKAFTLVEMLIVMGIIIILMAVGITAGRYAINRANDVAHQNAVDNMYTAVQAYYADHRSYPAIENFSTALTDDTVEYYIGEYMDDGAFDGGTAATYYYATDTLQQEVLVCVSLFGQYDSGIDGDFYCNGNGFGSENLLNGSITDKIVPRIQEGTTTLDQSPMGEAFNTQQNWLDDSTWGAVVTAS
ncbi:MAG: type II secretion system protein [Candidatus Dojkabacteria bacterium]|nr:type II secretion system protein [Candidatus Dojkabacteria bacterium]